MKTAIGCVAHVNDEPLFRACLKPSLDTLTPPPDILHVEWNDGGGLKQLRERCFETCFNRGADVVLSVDSDFSLFPRILRYVRRYETVSYAFLSRHPRDLFLTVAGALPRVGWSGCYSLSREWYFRYIRSRWNGEDTAVKLLSPRYHFVRTPMYYVLRPYREESMGTIRRLPPFRRMRWMALRLRR